MIRTRSEPEPSPLCDGTLLLNPPLCCSSRKQDAGQGQRAAGVWQQLAEGQVGEEGAEHGRPVQAGGPVEGEERPKTVRPAHEDSLLNKTECVFSPDGKEYQAKEQVISCPVTEPAVACVC